MNVCIDLDDLRKIRFADPLAGWGLVPTMGYLHDGHLSLVRKARQENERVAVTIFVNPIQFNHAGDLEAYPQNLQRDLQLLASEKADLVWTPAADQVYPPDYQTYIDVRHITRHLEGAARPGHFKGVATIVAKLFNIFQPDRAYFGQKDAQQVEVVKRMVRDLNYPVKVINCPTVREPDGLAMSSRNARLSVEGRKKAACLYRALQAAKADHQSGEQDAGKLKSRMIGILEQNGVDHIDYVSVAKPGSLEELETIEGEALLSLAVDIHNVRLIDNIFVGGTS